MEGIGLTGLYEICFEQSWKMMKEVLESKGVYRKRTGTARKQQAVRPHLELPIIANLCALFWGKQILVSILRSQLGE